MSHTPDQPDKGYTTGFYDGKQAEQDRILALLEAAHYENTWEHYPTKWVYMENCMACNALWLIKGESDAK